MERTRGDWLRVYVDGVMALNFAVDFLLLLGTEQLSGIPGSKKRMAAAAAVGALYSGICLVPEFRFLGNLLWRGVMLAVMGTIAFGCRKSAPECCGLFLLLSFALGGLGISLGRADPGMLILAAGLLWLICRLGTLRTAGAGSYVPLEIAYEGRRVQLLALRDTGNTLRDPVTGEEVLVLSADAASRLTGLTLRQLQTPLETMAEGALPGLRLIPFRTVGQGGGMMLAMAFSDVWVNGKHRKAVAAFAPENFNKNAEFQALTGGLVS